jgi:hypothetical protein
MASNKKATTRLRRLQLRQVTGNPRPIQAAQIARLRELACLEMIELLIRKGTPVTIILNEKMKRKRKASKRWDSHSTASQNFVDDLIAVANTG